MPEKLPIHEKIFNSIQQQVIYIHTLFRYFNWVFVDDFNQNRRKRAILQSASPTFFNITLRLFYDHLLLSTAKLIDPASSGKSGKNENLSLYKLIEVIPDTHAELKRISQILLNEIKDHINSIKYHRDKRIAHNDLPTNLQTSSLPRIEETNFIEALGKITQLLNEIEHELWGSTLDYNTQLSKVDEPERLLELLSSNLLARDAQRNIGEELLNAIRDVKTGQQGDSYSLDRSYAAEKSTQKKQTD